MFKRRGDSQKLHDGLESNSPIAVLFTGSPPPNRCGQRFADPMPPVFDQMAKEFRDRVIAAKIDIFRDTPTARDFGVRTIPTIVFLRGRAEVERFEGAISDRTLRWYFERVMSPTIAPDDEEVEGDAPGQEGGLLADSEPTCDHVPAQRRGLISIFRK